MKQIIKAVLTSLSYVTIPSLILSLGIGLLTGRYISIFLVAFALIFLIGLVSNNWFQTLIVRHNQLVEFKKKELESQQSIEVSCASCKSRNIVPVRLNKRNTFPCTTCKVSNLVVFEFATAVVTEPIKLPQIGANVHA